MLLLTFKAAESFYAIDVAHVVEVVPRVDLRRLPHTPDFIAGVFDYRGTIVPVIDLGSRLGSDTCRDRLSTRIILVNCRPPDRHLEAVAEDPISEDNDQGFRSVVTTAENQRFWLLGLIAEQVSDVKSVKPEQFISATMQLPELALPGSDRRHRSSDDPAHGD